MTESRERADAQGAGEQRADISPPAADPVQLPAGMVFGAREAWMFSRGLLAIALFACLSIAQADEPQWLKDARARESKPIATRKLTSMDSWLKARVPARVIGPIIKLEDSYSLKLDIGAATPIYCSIMPGDINLADTLRRAADVTLTKLANAQGKLEVRQIEQLDAGAYGNVPFIAATWAYTAESGKGLMAGEIKQVAMTKDGVGVYCAHVDLGYAATFQSVVRALASSLVTPAAPNPPYYQEISAMTLGDTKCGVNVSTLRRNSSGGTTAREVTAMLTPGTRNDAVSLDSTHTEMIDSDAHLLTAIHVTSRNGEVTTNLALRPKDSDWIVEGELQGKQVSVALPKGAAPGTWVAQALELRKLLATPDPVATEHGIALWASSDPGRLTESKLKVLSKVDATHYRAAGSTGTVNADMTLDAITGMATATEIRIGPQQVNIERIYVNGAF
jgi:hypothetical protein